MKDDERIIEELQRSASGLLMMSESDYPFEVIRWGKMEKVTPDFLRRIAAQPPDAAIASESLEDFFHAAMTVHGGDRAAARAVAEKFRALVQLLKTHLSEARVYKVGKVNLPVYIVGRAPSGNWLGLATRVVET